MELIAMNILGPLPEFSAGNSYVLVIGNYFTKCTQSLIKIPSLLPTNVLNLFTGFQYPNSCTPIRVSNLSHWWLLKSASYCISIR